MDLKDIESQRVSDLMLKAIDFYNEKHKRQEYTFIREFIEEKKEEDIVEFLQEILGDFDICTFKLSFLEYFSIRVNEYIDGILEDDNPYIEKIGSILNLYKRIVADCKAGELESIQDFLLNNSQYFAQNSAMTGLLFILEYLIMLKNYGYDCAIKFAQDKLKEFNVSEKVKRKVISRLKNCYQDEDNTIEVDKNTDQYTKKILDRFKTDFSKLML